MGCVTQKQPQSRGVQGKTNNPNYSPAPAAVEV